MNKLKRIALKNIFEYEMSNTFISEELELLQIEKVFEVSESEKKLIFKHIRLAGKYGDEFPLDEKLINKIKIFYKIDMKGRMFSYADDGYVAIFPEGMFMTYYRPTFGVVQFWETDWGIVVQFSIGLEGATNGRFKISYKFKQAK